MTLYVVRLVQIYHLSWTTFGYGVVWVSSEEEGIKIGWPRPNGHCRGTFKVYQLNWSMQLSIAEVSLFRVLFFCCFCVCVCGDSLAGN